LKYRPRRLRKSKNIRALTRETKISPDNFIHPVFVVEGQNVKEEIPGLSGFFHRSVDLLPELIDEILALGINAVLIFGIPEAKDEQGSYAWKDEGAVQKAVLKLKKQYPKLVIFSDLCLCAYTSHGHCGIVRDDKIDNDKTLKVLEKVALSHAQAGVDFVSPSDMMDGRVSAVRRKLDQSGYSEVGIMSYSAKYASTFYGPFRDAARSEPSFGDRKTYQMDPANSLEAAKEVKLDINEGADIVMVKPALPYLDIIKGIKESINIPLAAYSVSGEYAMIKAASKEGVFSDEEVMFEVMTAIKRAGADIIITYYAKEMAGYCNKGVG